MSVFVQYPDDWIGVPEFGADELFATARDWAQALTEELITDAAEHPADEERAALVSALAVIGASVSERGAVASYVFMHSLRGPIDFADLVLVPRSAVGDAPAAEVAGALDPDAIHPPTVIALSTANGFEGALVIRHAPLDDDAPHIITLRASAALDIGAGYVVLGTSTTDLAGFEAFRPHFMALIESVSADG